MVYLKAILVSLVSVSFLFHTHSANAAPPQSELNQYLSEIGWTNQELQDYLAYYEIPLDEFDTIEDLKMIMGTPINSENFQELLTRYQLTEQELNALMDHFGDSVKDYKFIEDLDATVDFYVNHDEYMAEVENGLEDLGITEEETERFFNYLAQVEENNKNNLDQMETLDTRIEKFFDVEDPSQLSEEEINELVQILEESIALYEVKVTFSMNNKEITLTELLKMKEAPNNLYISVFSTAGELLIDFTLPAEFFETADVIDQGEDMIHVGELSDEYVDHMHDEKYKNAEKELK
ncbi:processed acidic surface protein [Niallia oryzisoli]|uniref:Processed acidic surface protein n=1 Tax=Niallia oryzisoli TaxID=1737571 RepID=A0ABZ2CBA2_9BACI